ncbi:unnamed protein product [Adineta ricciae]|uniref:EF-hand domain-containing protein n=1 Tax=Adineta ricciae TaxID=249248 RepID=A0A814LY51_ADIRI|nr:unnamed protein product [Adineta ricciae]
MSKNFSEEEIDNFRQCFQLFAPQGYVDTPDKLCFIMRSLSMAPTIAELKRYFTKYKKDAGVVEFDDFLKIVLEHRSTENTPNEIMAAFQLYDTQRHGYIDAKQLRYLLTNTGEKLTDKDVDLILRELNIGGEGNGTDIVSSSSRHYVFGYHCTRTANLRIYTSHKETINCINKNNQVTGYPTK